MLDPRAWHSRGYIPHFDPGEIAQFITFRLADSMPQNFLKRWAKELDNGLISNSHFRRRVEIYLDQNYGSASLRNPHVARLVQNALLNWNGDKYILISWVIMPNHVHILLRPLADHSISSIMHSIKSFTSHAANKMLEREGSFWSKEYFDRYIRNARHFINTVRYIEQNPVKAKLCSKAEDWEFGSAHFRIS